MSYYSKNTGLLALFIVCLGLATSVMAQTAPETAPPETAETETPVAGDDLLPEGQVAPEQSLFQEETTPDSGLKVDPSEQAPSLSNFLEKAGAQTDAVLDAPTPPPQAGMPVNPSAFNLETGAKLDSVASQKKNADEQLRMDAFNQVSRSLMPMKPAEIRRMLELYDETKQAAETPIYPSPEPESAFVVASLEPGSKPQTIKTAIGNVTTLSIVDVTGQPWPIQDLTWAGDFQIEQPESGSHMLRITPTSNFATGNVSMRLVGLNPPVIFSLRVERKTVHVRLDVQIPEVGPKGVLPPVMSTVSTKAGDSLMTSVLLGVAGSTEGVHKMNVEGVDPRTSAYDQDGTMYIRTPYTMLSPAWSKSVKSADGMNVYALDFTPVILLSDKGKMVKAYVSRKEQSDGE